MKATQYVLPTFFTVLFSVLITVNAYAADRHIHLNDQHLVDEQIAYLDMATGYQLPDGNYWVDLQTGAWGVEGNSTAIGYIVDEQQQAPAHQTTARNEYNHSQNGTYARGTIDGQDCQFVSAGEYTFKSCD